MKISHAFETFANEAPQYQQAFGQLIQEWGESSALEDKTNHLSYLAVLAATGKTSGLPAVGNEVIHALPIALEAYDAVD